MKMHKSKNFKLLRNSKFIQSFIQDVPLKSLQCLGHIQNDLLSLLYHFSLYFSIALKTIIFVFLVFSQHPTKSILYSVNVC